MRDMLRDQGVTENSARNFWQYPLTLRDVKNEDRSGDVYENKAETTKCHAKNAAFCKKMH